MSICLLLNRRHGHLRVIDFRAGPTVAKRNTILIAARREGIEKVFTLVERDEVLTWMRLGFSREGSIPGFYRRSDAWVMGIVVSEARPLSASMSLDDDDDDLPIEAPATPAAQLAERTVLRAKKLLRDETTALPSVKLAPVTDAEAQKAVLALQKKGLALTSLSPFGRDTKRTTYCCASKGVSVMISAEDQPFFQNTYLELLASPKSEAERIAATAALAVMTERLRAEGKVNAFSIVPADDLLLCASMLASGFRRSAALSSHLTLGGERKDAVVWSKRLVAAD
ncbi:MAG: hypothetical protein U0441_26415 [Polyangiaceae bacterium]